MESHRYVEHVGEVELELDAESEPGPFAEAAAAFRELVDGSSVEDRPQRREIVLAPEDDRELLLADWLSELVFLAETEGFVPRRVVDVDLHGGGLRAIVEGAHGSPRHIVKAVTLAGLEVSQQQGRWHGHVVLDV
jgi:SHS2 domain-containing protein